MDYKLIDAAYAGLLHDIGKFYQRIKPVSDLTDEELTSTPFNKKGGYHSHLHSGYTSRFLRKYLNMFNEFERLTAEHHLDGNEKLAKIIIRADHIASAIDRQDEKFDTNVENKKGTFIIQRLHSVLSEVDFGKKSVDTVFPLTIYDDLPNPISNYKLKSKEESSEEYDELFKQFIQEVKANSHLRSEVSFTSYNYMLNLMNRYLTTIPASTYGNIIPTVSLYDHLRLTSAIASCLYNESCYLKDEFYMIEIDVSGIQKFIYAVVEGSETKPKLVKELRGRSALVGILTNAISNAFIHEFGLTSSNILFNTGGGSMILLPYFEGVEKKVDLISKHICKELYKYFQTDITFVCAGIKLSGNELEAFQSEKSVCLKELLGEKKGNKFADIIDDDFFFEKIQNNQTCEMCGRKSDGKHCIICDYALLISDIYTKYDDFGIVYDYSQSYSSSSIKNEYIDFGFVKIYFVEELEEINEGMYVDAINGFKLGNRKMISNMVPIKNDNKTLNFENIIELQPKEFGDKKLAILKMDVDNLGGIFAYGLRSNQENRKQRSISKYVTMSRLFEYFFGNKLMHICQDVSLQINPNINTINKTMFYINYAGGDDLVIIGPAYGIAYLALEIHKQFSQFTSNENITISGGIHIQNDKKPIRFGILQAEEQLNQSKTNGKNAITLMNTTISFNGYDNILQSVNKMIEYLNKEQISRTMLYNIMSFVDDKSYEEFICLVPRIQYTLFRGIDQKRNKDVYTYMLTKLNTIESDIDVQLFVLQLKLLMLFTRER